MKSTLGPQVLVLLLCCTLSAPLLAQGRGGFGGPGAGEGNERFRVEFYVQGFNILNRTNFVNFSGNLQSPFFGTPTSAGQARRVEVGMQFRF